MGWFRTLFGGAGAAEKVLDVATDTIRGVGTWIDEKTLTDEERIKFTLEAGRAQLELIKTTADENSIRSVTRRWLAWGIAANTFALLWVGVGFAIAGRDVIVDKILALADAFSLGWAFVSVIVFYFGVQFFRTK